MLEKAIKEIEASLVEQESLPVKSSENELYPVSIEKTGNKMLICFDKN